MEFASWLGLGRGIWRGLRCQTLETPSDSPRVAIPGAVTMIACSSNVAGTTAHPLTRRQRRQNRERSRERARGEHAFRVEIKSALGFHRSPLPRTPQESRAGVRNVCVSQSLSGPASTPAPAGRRRPSPNATQRRSRLRHRNATPPRGDRGAHRPLIAALSA